ncbi:MAG TPA: hypothetical protein VLT84_04170 [Acidobacteriota bacterium]|nr:hypothetical protein [Acidobacteriota bacterium]
MDDAFGLYLVMTASAPADSAAPSAAPATDSSAAPPAAPGAALPQARSADWETLATGLPEEARVRFAQQFRYNRVDGPALLAGAEVRDERQPRALARVLAGYAFSRKRGLGEAEANVPLDGDRRFILGGSLYRRTATEDGWIVGEAENTIFALVARTDYRDHYESEGYEGRFVWRPGRDAGLAIGAVVEKQRSLRTRTRVALFGHDDKFRANPAIEPGEDGVVWGAVRIGPETIPSGGGSRIEIRYERSGDPIDGDFEYGRVRTQANWRGRLSPGQTARVRAIAASTRSGALPPQKVWDLGGIGTLRGEPHQRLHGDQFFLVNAEFARRARKNVDAIAFLDWGTAWFGRGAWDEARPLLDGGVGLRVGEGPTAITIARNLQRGDAPFVVGVRLGGTWE